MKSLTVDRDALYARLLADPRVAVHAAGDIGVAGDTLAHYTHRVAVVTERSTNLIGRMSVGVYLVLPDGVFFLHSELELPSIGHGRSDAIAFVANHLPARKLEMINDALDN